MKFILCLILVTFIGIITKSNIINPTVTNSSGDWYIVSKTSEPFMVSNYIECKNKYCHIICDEINGCNNTIINASASMNVEIQCSKDYSCNNIQLISSATNSTTLYCSGHKACSLSKLYFTETMNFISIICSSNENNFACFENSYYFPSNNTKNNNKETQININCFAFGCYHFGTIYVENYKLLNTKFSINGCNECNIVSECIHNYSIYCIDMNTNQAKNDLFMNGYCKSEWCQCDALHDVVYNDDTNINCPKYSYSTNEANKSNTDIIIVILIGVVVMSVFIGFVVLCYFVTSDPKSTQAPNCQKQQNETKSAFLYDSDYEHNNHSDNNIMNTTIQNINTNTFCYDKVSDETQHKSDEEDVSGSETSAASTSDGDIDGQYPPNRGSILIPTKIFCANHDKGLHRKSKRKLLTTYSMNEVVGHCTMKSCWIIVDNLVLDVTAFLKYHPGNVNAIIKHGGTACDEYFAFHSNAARQLFWKFVIGKIHQTNSKNCFIQ